MKLVLRHKFIAGPDERSKSVWIADLGRAKYIDGHQRWRIAQNRVNELLGIERDLYALVDDQITILASP